MAAANYYQHYPIHPHQRYHTTPVGQSAYTRNFHSNKSTYMPSRMKGTRMVEPTQILSDYRNGSFLPQSFAPIHHQVPSQKYDGKAILERTQRRIQEAHRKRGNLVEGKMRPIMKEPKKSIQRPKIQNNVQKPIISSDIGPIIKPAYKTVQNQEGQKPVQTKLGSTQSETKKPAQINLELPISATKIAVKSSAPPSIRKSDLKPQPNANNDWSTNYNDDFRNWQHFKTKKTESIESLRTAGQTATHHLNAEKRKYMERLNREEKEKSMKILSEKKAKQQEDIEKRRLDTQKVLDNLKNESENNNDKENAPKITTAQRFSSANTKFESSTTNASTFKRWPKSAFQTVASRASERPIWANPNGSQHFPVKQPRQKVLKDSTKHNMNITLSIDGTKIKNSKVASRSSNKSKFMSEYQSKYKTPKY